MSSRIEDDELVSMLHDVRTVAVVGLSPNAHRDSYRVASYLQGAGYRVIPVNPCAGCDVLGEPAREGLTELVESGIRPDLVNVFRRPAAVPALVSEVIALGLPRLWLQLGVGHPQAEVAAREAGVQVVSERCLMVEHRRLMGVA